MQLSLAVFQYPDRTRLNWMVVQQLFAHLAQVSSPSARCWPSRWPWPLSPGSVQAQGWQTRPRGSARARCWPRAAGAPWRAGPPRGHPHCPRTGAAAWGWPWGSCTCHTGWLEGTTGLGRKHTHRFSSCFIIPSFTNTWWKSNANQNISCKALQENFFKNTDCS